MKKRFRILSAAACPGLALAPDWRWPAFRADAQQQPAPAASAAAQAASPAAIAAAKEILVLKNAARDVPSAVPNLVEQTKNVAAAEQSELSEGHQGGRRERRARSRRPREGDRRRHGARSTPTNFTEQELKDLLTFYKSPLGTEDAASRSRVDQASLNYMKHWAQEFAEDVNGQVSRRDEEARQGSLSNRADPKAGR